MTDCTNRYLRWKITISQPLDLDVRFHKGNAIPISFPGVHKNPLLMYVNIKIVLEFGLE